MFDWLLNPIGSVLAWFSSWSGSYAIALLFYALIFKLVFAFFAVKQQKNQIAMAKLAPKIQIIKEKYRGRTDQATMRKQQQEIMELQQKEGYSMLSGCLPLLIQMPIIILLYNVIQSPLFYIVKLDDKMIVDLFNLVNNANLTVASVDSVNQIQLLGQIQGFADKDAIAALCGGVMPNFPNFNLGKINLSLTPSLKSISWLILIPILTAVFQWFSMFVAKKFSNQNQMQAGSAGAAQTGLSLKIMDLIFPTITLIMAFNFSAMLGLYWIYQSILGIFQTIIINKLMPIPKYTEEELKALRKAQKAQEKAQKAASKNLTRYKSLHYIDEDDYEELPEMAPKSNNNAKKNVGGNRPEIKD